MSLPRAETTLLGPYRLLHPLGRGGMGEVWAAQHVQRGEPAAVKLITGTAARDPRYQQAFRREVRAVAGLDHPGIVRVHDQGRVTAAASVALNLAEGAPWLAMELLGGGSLRQRGTVLAWPHLHRVLDALLAALAHAHARGVIHRDLKPDNVLASADHQRIVLTDFGVAHAADRDTGDLTDSANLGETVGTPAYMAPEQIKGHWRDQGPWTDLYALGCMAWELVAGAPPFMRSAGLATMVAQLSQPLPELVPRVAVPAALLAWLTRLLAKSPEQRYAHAADARLALSRIAARPGATLPTWTPERVERPPAAAPAAVQAATLAERGADAAGRDPFAEPFADPFAVSGAGGIANGRPASGLLPDPAGGRRLIPQAPEPDEPMASPAQGEGRGGWMLGLLGVPEPRREARDKHRDEPRDALATRPDDPQSARHPGHAQLTGERYPPPATERDPAQHTPRLDPESMEPAVLVTGLLTPGSADPALAPTLASDAAMPVPQPDLPFSVGPFEPSEADLGPEHGHALGRLHGVGGPAQAPGPAVADPRPACPPDWRVLEWTGESEAHLISAESTATLELGPTEPQAGEAGQRHSEGPRPSGATSLALSTHGLEAEDEPSAPGLGLFGLRTIPFVGREIERDALWAGLRRVTEVGEAHGVLLMGPSGYGKSRLTDWLAERAQEVGTATAVRVLASQSRGPSDGIGAMVRRVVRGQGLERSELFARVQAWLVQHGGADSELAELLVALVHPVQMSATAAVTPTPRDTSTGLPTVLHLGTDTGDADASSPGFGGTRAARAVDLPGAGAGAASPRAEASDPQIRGKGHPPAGQPPTHPDGGHLDAPPAAELLTAATRLIARLASVRPVVLVLEDVQWAPQVLDWARQLLSHAVAPPGPVLVLVTLRTDATEAETAERPTAQA